MKLLLDENLPKRLKIDLGTHQIYTVADKGWFGVSNGRLLELLIQDDFDALITFDKNLQYQQNFKKYSIAVIVLNAPDNSYKTLKNLITKIEDLLKSKLNAGPHEIKG